MVIPQYVLSHVSSDGSSHGMPYYITYCSMATAQCVCADV